MDKNRLYEICDCAAKYFNYLLYHTDGKALSYLKAKRGFSEETIQDFQLGYAPNEEERLVRYLRKQGYSNDEMVAANLAVLDSSGYLISRFRDRVMVPICDDTGRVIAFGGRLLGEKSKWNPKYLNSSDTDIFKKSDHLFSFHRAKESHYPYFILCEGYMDVISMVSAGFDNAVASLGTSLTESQILLLQGATDCVIIAYDADEPGQAAADKAVLALLQAGLCVKVLQLPSQNGKLAAKDPDEFIQAFGADAFEKVLDQSVDDVSFRLMRFQQTNDIKTPSGALKALAQSVQLFTAQQ